MDASEIEIGDIVIYRCISLAVPMWDGCQCRITGKHYGDPEIGFDLLNLKTNQIAWDVARNLHLSPFKQACKKALESTE